MIVHELEHTDHFIQICTVDVNLLMLQLPLYMLHDL